jgi:hypothetical protein
LLATLPLVALTLAPSVAWCGLVPNDVVVVYNSNSAYPESKKMADYYCQESNRAVPADNECGIDWAAPVVAPYDFGPKDIVTPSEFEESIRVPLA